MHLKTVHPGDVYLHWRTDGSLFNLARLKAKTKTTTTIVRDLLFADDVTLVAHSESSLQKMMDCLSAACKAFALEISTKKTVILSQADTVQASISLDNMPLQDVDKFCYLGSTVTSSNSLDNEINIRIGKAATTFGKLTKRAWDNKMLNIRTKVKIYQACVLSSLLYGSETWTMYAKQERKLNTFHLRCLRKILGIVWQDRIPNTEVLDQASIQSIPTIICKRRLRWLGHVKRMDDSRIPKQLLYGELQGGKRRRGRPHLRFKDTCKSSLSKCNIDSRTWEELAVDRMAWREAVHHGTNQREQNVINNITELRQRRKQSSANDPCGTYLQCKFCNRICASNIGRISHERSCQSKV